MCAGGALGQSISTLGVLRTAVEQARLWGRDMQGVSTVDPMLGGVALWERRTRRAIGYEEMPRLAAMLQTGLERTA